MNFSDDDPSESGLSRYRRDEWQLVAMLSGVSGHENKDVDLLSGLMHAICLKSPSWRHIGHVSVVEPTCS